MAKHSWNENHGPDELYDKFTVTQNSTGKILGLDGEWVFPLRPERDMAAVVALEAYAEAVAYRAPNLAAQIQERCALIKSKEGVV